MENNKESYNSEPVYYCTKCLSLRIRHIVHMSESEYCDTCGSTDIQLIDIDTWKHLYKEKYGHEYLDKEQY